MEYEFVLVAFTSLLVSLREGIDDEAGNAGAYEHRCFPVSNEDQHQHHLLIRINQASHHHLIWYSAPQADNPQHAYS